MSNKKKNRYISSKDEKKKRNNSATKSSDPYESKELSSFSDKKLNDSATSKNYSNDKTIDQIVKHEKKKQKIISKKNRHMFAWIRWCMILTVAVAFSLFAMNGIKDMLAIGRTLDSTVAISIPKNASNSDVADILSKSGVINDPGAFTLYTSIFKNSSPISNGDYEIKTNMEYGEIISYINTQRNRVDTKNVTFAEGLTITECAELLEAEGVCGKDEFLTVCNSSEFDESYSFIKDISNASDRYYKLEGYLYPDTYTVYSSVDPKYVVKKMLNNFETKIIDKHAVTGYDEKISIKDIAAKNNMSVDYLINLASMVQAEAADQDDMKIIAGIFLNRLTSDDPAYQYLNSDPTVCYPYRTEASAPTGFKGTYDTYTHPGLPAGPIRNPGAEAIDAVLNPTETSYMYFCHDAETGKPYYARTESQHNENLVKAGLK